MLTANSQVHGPNARMAEAIVGPKVNAVATTSALWPKPRPSSRLGIDEADQRRVHAHDAAGAEPLQRAGDQQARQRPGQRAAERCQREQDQSAEIDALVADDLAERAERQQRRHQRDLVDVDDPDHIGRADVKIGGNGGQRDIGDRGVERGHRHAR